MYCEDVSTRSVQSSAVMAWCDRGVQIVLTSLGAFAAISLMTVAIGTDFWLYSRAHICNTTNATDEPHTMQQSKKTRGDLTHSGLWRICCIEGKWMGYILICRLVVANRNKSCDFYHNAVVLLNSLKKLCKFKKRTEEGRMC